MKIKIEDLDLDNTVCPAHKNKVTFSSSAMTGIQLVVKDNGRKEFFLRYISPDSKKQNVVGLGLYPVEISDLETLYDKAKEAKELVKAGVDPSIHKKFKLQQKRVDQYRAGAAVDSNYRFSNIASNFILHKENTISDAGVKKYQSALNVHLLPEMAGSDIRYFDTLAFEQLISRIAKKSPSAGRNVLSTCRALFSYAMEKKLIQANPLKGQAALIKKTVVAPSDRVLSPNELHQFLNELTNQDISEDAKFALLLQIHTGIRIGEILSIKYSRIDFRTRTIKHIIKGGKTASTIMSDQVRRLLLEWKREYPDRDRVFMDSLDTRQIVEEMRKTQKWIKFGSHDIRRSVRTFLQQLGCPNEIRKLITNHAGVTGVDVHYDHDKQEEAQLHWITLWNEKLAEVKKFPTALHKGIDVAEDDPYRLEQK